MNSRGISLGGYYEGKGRQELLYINIYYTYYIYKSYLDLKDGTPPSKVR
jgi:hypothetical protein